MGARVQLSPGVSVDSCFPLSHSWESFDPGNPLISCSIESAVSTVICHSVRKNELEPVSR